MLNPHCPLFPLSTFPPLTLYPLNTLISQFSGHHCWIKYIDERAHDLQEYAVRREKNKNSRAEVH